MPFDWPVSTTEILVAPGDDFGLTSVHDSRFVDRKLVQPGPGGRLLWPRLADVLATVADVIPLSLYEAHAHDVTAMLGPSVHCYFTGGREALVEMVDAQGWRRFSFRPEPMVTASLIEAITAGSPSAPDRLLGCTLADGRGGVVLSDGVSRVLGDLPDDHGPVKALLYLSVEDVHVLMLARLRMPVVA